MPNSETELEERLKEAGNSLLNPPSSVDDLLDSLDVMSHHPFHLFIYLYMFALCACLFFFFFFMFVDIVLECWIGLIIWCMDINVSYFWWRLPRINDFLFGNFVKNCCCCCCHLIWSSSSWLLSSRV